MRRCREHPGGGGCWQEPAFQDGCSQPEQTERGNKCPHLPLLPPWTPLPASPLAESTWRAEENGDLLGSWGEAGQTASPPGQTRARPFAFGSENNPLAKTTQ